MIEFLDLRWSDARSWPLVPQLFGRIIEFCEKYGSDADPGRLIRSVATNYIAEPPILRAFGFVETKKFEDGTAISTLRGHVLVEVDEWAGRRCLTVVQFEIDHGYGITPELLQHGRSVLDEWARLEKATDVRIVARNEAVARLFRSRYGYEPRGVLMKKAVSNG